ncbi:MAG: protein kinase [Candidatus Aminicenantes bacterium]|nr:protein kinase [Candidatus Aminicenantes bacterium]
MAIKCPKCHFENPEDTLYCGKCATPLPPSEESPALTETLEAPKEELTTGATFAERYQIIEELGKGGMGRVYKVLDTKINEKIALKLLKPEIASDKKTIERFSNELKFARKVRHENVCQMYDLNEEKSLHYITMEFVPGEDLKSMIRMSGQLSLGTTINIAKKVCQGLAAAHKVGVVHRDLKPQNVMIDKEGNARIMDFGIARSAEGKGITGAGVMIGTPEYMSPEQVEGKEVDQRSDIYSLGVILYEMVTGQVPFEGDTPFTIGIKHKSEAPKDPREINTQIPEDLSRVILKCMEKDKENRYQSAGEVRSELENIEKGIPTTQREIPRRKPITTREITVTLGLKKLFLPALIIAAIVIIAVLIWQLFPKKVAIPAAPSDKPSIAIMYFENNTGDESLDHYRKAISDLLITDLAQSKHLKILRGDTLFNILKQLNLLEAKSYSSEDLKKVADQGGATHILQGNYTKAGESFRINYLLHEASNEELIGSEMVEGVGEKSIFSMVDDITRRIKANFRLSPEEIASDIDKEVDKITTSFPEAFKYYIEGREYQDKGDTSKAIQFMEKAIAIDPEFAMAYRLMAIANGNMGLWSERMKCLQRALELSDRVSDRERYQIQGDFYAHREQTYEKAIEAYKKLLQLYPDDSTANINLGVLYIWLEEWDKAIERYKFLLQNKNAHSFTYTNLAEVYRNKGLYEKAEEVVKYFINNFSDNAWAHIDLALTYMIQHKYDLALSEIDRAISLDPDLPWNTLAKGHIYYSKGDWIQAENEYTKLLELEEQAVQIVGRTFLAGLYISQGKFAKSKEQLDRGIELVKKMGEKQAESGFRVGLGRWYLSSGYYEKALREFEKAGKGYGESDNLRGQRYALFFKSLTHIMMKSLPEAQSLADELKGLIAQGMNQKEMRFYYLLVGWIELEREDFSKAIENFKKAILLMPGESDPTIDEEALFIEPLALAYYKAGDLVKAQEECLKITQLTSGRLFFGGIYAKSFLMLGKIFEQKGWKGKAIEHYEKFLSLWKEADPGIPEVDDAKNRLAALKI